MATIGYNTTVGYSEQVRQPTFNSEMLTEAASVYMPASNDTLTEFWLYGRSNSATTRLVNVAVYDITSGVNNAPLVGSSSLTLAAYLDGNQWVGTTGLSIALTGGNDYAIIFYSSADGDIIVHRISNTGACTTVTDTTSPSDPAVVNSTIGDYNYNFAFYAVTSGGGASSPTITSHPASVQPGQVVDVTVSDSGPVTGATFAGISVTPSKPDGTTVRYTVPDAYANGLAFKSQTFEITDGTTPDSTTTTLNSPTNIDYEGTVSGYPPPSGQYSFLDDLTVTAADGDYYLVRDPNLLIDTINADGTVVLNGEGDIFVRLHDVSDTTDSSQGTYTEERTVTVSEPDTTAPTVTSVSVPAAGSYKAGDNLDLTVNWSEVVDVTGTPAINLTIGGSSRQANYVSGTGTNALLFRYAVQAGDNDADGIAVGALTLDGGTIQDQASTPNAANLTLNSVGDTSGVLVDTANPSLLLGNVTTTNTAPTITATVGDSVSVNLNVNGVDYTPTPSGGEISQTLNTLALGTYTMTLDGTDQAGNTSQVTAELNIVAEDPWPYPEDTASIPRTWNWGGRHPKTSARVRKFHG